MQKKQQKDGVLEFNGKKYAVGLTWLTAEEEPDQKLLKQRAQALKADFYALRQTISVQNGFGKLDMGHRRSMPAAAASAADVLVGEWHGVFSADNGWWYVAVHSDAIAPDGDILFDNEEEAYNHFVERNENYTWPRSFAPEEWNLPDTTGEVSLDKVFDDLSLTNLIALNLDGLVGGRRNKKILFLIGILALIGLITLISLQSVLPNLLPERAEPLAPKIDSGQTLFAPPKARQLAQGEDELLQLESEKPGLVLNLPRPSGVLKLCVETMDLIAIPLPNWEIQSIECDGKSVIGKWRSNSSAAGLQSIQPYLDEFPRGTKHNYNGTNTYEAVIPADIGALFPINTRLIDRDIAIVELNERFSGIGDLSVSYIPPSRVARTRSRQNARNNRQEEEIVVPGTLKVTLATKAPPTVIANYFDVPGVSIRKISWNVNRARWNYEAVVTLKVN